MYADDSSYPHMASISASNAVTSFQVQPVVMSAGVSFCTQPRYCNQPWDLTVRFQLAFGHNIIQLHSFLPSSIMLNYFWIVKTFRKPTQTKREDLTKIARSTVWSIVAL